MDARLKNIGLSNAKAHWNLTPSELIEHIIKRGEGHLTDTGAIAIDTGKFTGRSPKDRFIVADKVTNKKVWWGDINIKFSDANFEKLYNKVTGYLNANEIFVRDVYACADKDYQLNVRVVTEKPYSSLFAHNMFIRPDAKELKDFSADWNILCAPGFYADPEVDGTRQSNFAVVNFSKKILLIGGTGYTGEIKKGIFSALNFLLPVNENVLPMHCSANVGKNGDTALFFGLSGTGKTTLSSDENRKLVGDDEHGWSDNSVFNFEGGCYAKTIDLNAIKEPQIFKAIKYGALLENIGFYKNSSKVNYKDVSKTQNTRVSYPLHHIDNIMEPSVAPNATNLFFLTCDAFGILPPISKLTPGQAMYHFISGYTAKVAGTEAGITEPQTAFSACFGAPFLPLHPTEYAEMLGKKMKKHKVNVWLINTGWSGGAYGVGDRIKLKYTRAMITAALEGKLAKVKFEKHPVFGLSMPKTCPNVPDQILNPRNTWDIPNIYDLEANKLAKLFNDNFKQFASNASKEILAAAPKEK